MGEKSRVCIFGFSFSWYLRRLFEPLLRKGKEGRAHSGDSGREGTHRDPGIRKMNGGLDCKGPHQIKTRSLKKRVKTKRLRGGGGR